MLITNAEHVALPWLAERVRGWTPSGQEVAIASVRDNRITAVVAYANYRGGNIEMTCAGEGNWMTRGNLAGFYAYPFVQLGCRRVTALVHRKNAKSRKLMERLGYTLEGKIREAAEDGRDLMLYGLLKSEADHILKHQDKTKWVKYG